MWRGPVVRQVPSVHSQKGSRCCMRVCSLPGSGLRLASGTAAVRELDGVGHVQPGLCMEWHRGERGAGEGLWAHFANKSGSYLNSTKFAILRLLCDALSKSKLSSCHQYLLQLETIFMCLWLAFPVICNIYALRYWYESVSEVFPVAFGGLVGKMPCLFRMRLTFLFSTKRKKRKKKGKDVVVKINQWLPIFLACFTLLCWRFPPCLSAAGFKPPHGNEHPGVLL